MFPVLPRAFVRPDVGVGALAEGRLRAWLAILEERLSSMGSILSVTTALRSAACRPRAKKPKIAYTYLP
jgi:hypothetical protein